MAGHRVQTIGSGMDQPDISTWNASLTVSQDEEGQLQNEIYSEGAITLSSTSATDILLTALAAERGTGVQGTGPRLVRSGDFSVSIVTKSVHGSLGLRVEWLEIDMAGNGVSAILTNGSQYRNVPVWRNSLIHGQSGGLSFRGLVYASSYDIRLQNVIAYDNYQSTNSIVNGFNLDADEPDGGCVNCTVYDIHNGGNGDARGVASLSNDSDGEVKNTMVGAVVADGTGTAFSFYFPGTNPDSTNNLSEDDTADDAGGTGHTINSTNPGWVDPTGTPPDFHLNSEASDAHGTGVDLGSANEVGVDIDGTDRDTDIGADLWDKGAHQFVGGGVAISPASLSSAEAFGAPSLVAGAVDVAPAGVASSESIGLHAVSLGGVSVTPGGLISSEAFGGPTVAPGAITVNPSAVVTGEAFGAPSLGFVIVPASIASAEALGAVLVAPGGVPLSVSAIASLENIGAHLVTNGGAFIAPGAIESAETHGNATLVPGVVTVTPDGMFTTEIFGDTSISVGGLALLPGGVVSLEAFGGHTLSMGGVFIAPGGVPSLELFGGPTLALNLQFITPSGVESVAALGVPIVIAGTGLQTLKLVEAVQRTFIFHADQRLFIFSQSR